MEDSNFESWKVAQETAKHFNGLILDFRTKSIIALVGTTSIVSAVISKFIEPSYLLLSIALFFIYLFWKCFQFLDIYYYNNLLLGTIDNIKILESRSKNSTSETKLSLSEDISRKTSEIVPKLFYNFSCILILLLSLSILCFWISISDKDINKNIIKIIKNDNIEYYQSIYLNNKNIINIFRMILTSFFVLEIIILILNLKKHFMKK